MITTEGVHRLVWRPGIADAIGELAQKIMNGGGTPRRVLLGAAWMVVGWEDAFEPNRPFYPYPSGWSIDTPAGVLPIYFLNETDWLIGVDEIEPTIPGTR